MIVIPAIDVLDHKVVQLVGGVPGSQQVVLPDVRDTVRMWISRDASYLHLVDLDAAFGKEDNSDIFSDIIRDCGVPCEIGGGIRSEQQVKKYVDAGADRIIVGTKAVKDPGWLKDMSLKYPGKIVLGLDTKGGKISIKGWQEEVDTSIASVFDRIRELPLAGVLNTNIDVEGQGKGVNFDANARFIKACPHKVIVSGGVTTPDDCKATAGAGACAVVVGMAVYKGSLRPWEWIRPWTVRTQILTRNFGAIRNCEGEKCEGSAS